MEKPPIITELDLLGSAFLLQSPEVACIVNKMQEQYAYWDKVKYQALPANVDHKKLWACVKFARKVQRVYTWDSIGSTLSITNNMQKQCHELDMQFGGSWGASSAHIPNANREQYLISSLMEEAISSSQMEGASTTRKVAKDMLRQDRPPKNHSDQMIYNNYQTIQYIVANKERELTPEILLHIHHLMTMKTLESPEEEGAFRTKNDIVVADGITNEVVHQPPEYTTIDKHIEDLCVFFNKKGDGPFIHPIIRAILIHYMVAYIHPFVDGNGRTARALFYWCMLKEGYWLTEYLSISRIIYKSKVSYEKAFIQVANDDKDMGYFVAYHLDILEKSFREFQSYLQRKMEQRSAVKYHQIANLNVRQAEIVRLFNENDQMMLTVKEIQTRFNVSHTTAKTDLSSLVDERLLKEVALNKVKKGYIKADEFDHRVNKT